MTTSTNTFGHVIWWEVVEGLCPCVCTTSDSYWLVKAPVEGVGICVLVLTSVCIIPPGWLSDRKAVQFYWTFQTVKKRGKSVTRRCSIDYVAVCALPVSLATDILTCCSAAAGSWQGARKHPACTQSHILSFASIAPASRNSHFTFLFSILVGFWDQLNVNLKANDLGGLCGVCVCWGGGKRERWKDRKAGRESE